MFFKFFNYLRFLISSSNQHGIHSPFVYKFITEGLYAKKNSSLNSLTSSFHFLSKKQRKLLYKITSYFNIETILVLKNVQQLNQPTKGNNIFLCSIKNISPSTFKKIDSNSIVLIYDIHKNKKSFNKWRNIAETSSITVTIDIFYFGLLIARDKQEKEHFIVRV